MAGGGGGGGGGDGRGGGASGGMGGVGGMGGGQAVCASPVMHVPSLDHQQGRNPSGLFTK